VVRVRSVISFCIFLSGYSVSPRSLRRGHTTGITWVYVVSARAPFIPLVKESKLVYHKPDICRLIKSRRVGWVCHVTFLGNLGSAYWILWHEKGRDYLEGILVGGKMPWILKKWSWKVGTGLI
jgi:hypothetical protein